MIRYALTCDRDHRFESWFQSSDAFDALAKGGHLSCAVCGSSSVDRALMTPSVGASERPAPDLKTPASEAEATLAEMRRHLEENCDYVGKSFAAEARKIHDGDAPARSIWGEAKFEDARKLIDDGVSVAPLPFFPKRKAN